METTGDEGTCSGESGGELLLFGLNCDGAGSGVSVFESVVVLVDVCEEGGCEISRLEVVVASD